MTERQGGTPPPRLFREWGSPAFGVQTGRGSGLPVPKPLRPEPEIGGPMQQPPAHAVMCNRSRVLGGPPELRITRVRPEPFSPPPQSFSAWFPRATSLPHTCCPRPHLCPPGSSCWGTRGEAPRLRAAAPGARSAPSRPVPRRSGRPRRFTRPRLSEPLPSPPPPPGLISHSGAGTPTPPDRRRHRRVAMETLLPPPPRALTHTLAGAQPLRTGRLWA